jgi:aminoglycoside phosphotransferase family enzyme
MLKIKNLNLSNIIKINKTKNFIITKHQYIFENNEKKFCYKKLKSVLKKWHKNNLLHGDLKPEHFIFHDNTVTLIDPISKPKKFSGTYHFLCFFEKLGFKTRWTENLNLKLIIKRI